MKKLIASSLTFVLCIGIVGTCLFAIIFSGIQVSHIKQGRDCYLLNCSITNGVINQTWWISKKNSLFYVNAITCGNNCEQLLSSYCSNKSAVWCSYRDNSDYVSLSKKNDDSAGYIIGITFGAIGIFFTLCGAIAVGIWLFSSIKAEFYNNNNSTPC